MKEEKERRVEMDKGKVKGCRQFHQGKMLIVKNFGNGLKVDLQADSAVRWIEGTRSAVDRYFGR